jgi:hypothetical protein
MNEFVLVVAMLCKAHGGECFEAVVTDQATMKECSGNVAVQELPRWFALGPYMEMGFHLAGWRCQVKRTPV